MARDLLFLRQRVKLLQRPGLLVLDQAADAQFVGSPVDLGRFVQAVIGVERKRPRDHAVGIRRRQLVGIEQQRLRAVVESGNLAQHALGAGAVEDVAAGEESERAEARRRRAGTAAASDRGEASPASLISSCLSTPGMGLRMRVIGTLLTPPDHGAQALRHQQRHDDVDDDEADDRGHGKEMHVARGVVAAEQSGQFLQLDRLPDRQPRQHDHARRPE